MAIDGGSERGVPASYDLVIVGSGGGGLVAALTAAQRGLTTLVIEKQQTVGGSTAMSGGTLWLPANPVSRRAGVVDSVAAAARYLDAVVGPDEGGSPQERRRVFVEGAAELAEWLESSGVPLRHCRGYSDYTDAAGSMADGRVVEPELFDRSALAGDDGWLAPSALPVVLYSGEAAQLGPLLRTGESRRALARVLARTLRHRLARRRVLTGGAALIGHLLTRALAAGVELRPGTRVTGLLTDTSGRVVGVRSTGPEGEIRAGAVLIAAGGFARSPELRAEHLPAPTSAGWTSSNPGETGDLLTAALACGASTAQLDEAWWVPTAITPDGTPALIVSEKAKPHCIIVAADGRRFVNEASSYMAVGQAMYARNAAVPAVPCWLIMDARHRRRYLWQQTLPGRMPRSWIRDGFVVRGETLADLAVACGIDADGLGRQVATFNAAARAGVDAEFGRGGGAYDRYYGDTAHHPNPSLGSLEVAPFYAVRLYPGDIGTAGGLRCDEHGRVLRATDEPIPGLYATGNVTASVMGRTYPGAGASIAASMLWGRVAALHHAGAGQTIGDPA